MFVFVFDITDYDVILIDNASSCLWHIPVFPMIAGQTEKKNHTINNIESMAISSELVGGKRVLSLNIDTLGKLITRGSE